MARGGRFVQLEGPDASAQCGGAVSQLQAAHDCYYSDAYQEALSHAKGASQRELSIVES